jgi:tRNA G10  N-methylase Trm11
LKGYKVGFTKESLKNKTKPGCNIFTNFREYKLPIPNIFRADINQIRFIKKGFIDVIMCDPPYGFRAMARENTGKTIINEDINDKFEKVDAKNKENNIKDDKNIGDKNFETDYYKKDYNPFDQNEITFKVLKHCEIHLIFDRLLENGTELLSKGGRIVCLYPLELQDDEIG